MNSFAKASTVEGAPLSDDDLDRIHAYWRAANYLSIGQIYLLDNPLLQEALTLEHIKPHCAGYTRFDTRGG